MCVRVRIGSGLVRMRVRARVGFGLGFNGNRTLTRFGARPLAVPLADELKPRLVPASPAAELDVVPLLPSTDALDAVLEPRDLAFSVRWRACQQAVSW